MSQWILIDDSDSSITYNTVDLATSWSAVNKSIPGTVDLDNAIFQTGHVLSSDGSLSFSFTGIGIGVYGVSSKLDPSREDDISDLSWTCSIDDVSIPANRTALRGFPWTSYCSQTGMSNQLHVLRVNVSASESSQFWLDYIRYIPPPEPLPANQTILVESTDPAVQYGEGWEPLGTARIMEPLTQDATAGLSSDAVSMNFTFNGTGITWYSLTLRAIMKTENSLSGAFPSTTGLALITMDGAPWNVTIPINSSPDDPSYDMPLFWYDGLDPATEHVLTATYMADARGVRMPSLTLDFLLVQAGPGYAAGNSSGINSPGASSSAPPPSQPTSPLPPETQALGKGQRPAPAGAIMGAVLGPFLFVFAVLLAVCLWRKRKLKRTAHALSALTDGATSSV